MYRRTSHRTRTARRARRSTGLLASLLTVLALAVAPMLVGATAAEAAECGYRSEPVPNVALPAGSWTHNVGAKICNVSATAKTVETRLNFRPRSGFNSANVIGCTAYLRLIHVGGSTSEWKPVSCLTAARNPVGGNSDAYTWTIGRGSGYYWVEGYANVVTPIGVYNGNQGVSYSDSFLS